MTIPLAKSLLFRSMTDTHTQAIHTHAHTKFRPVSQMACTVWTSY